MVLSNNEVVGTFDAAQQFSTAVFALESAGFDRAQLTILGRETEARECLAAAECGADRRGDTHNVPRAHDAVVLDEDDQQERVLLTSLTASVAALVAAGAALTATGGAAAPAIAAALGAGGASGGIADYLGRRRHDARAKQLERDVLNGGIALWVRTPDDASEEKARRVLTDHGARDVHAQIVGAN